MCGLTGFVGTGDRDDLAAMMAALAHRGPDGEGAYHDPETAVFLGHRRLAIIDPEGGAQPMWNADGALGVVYNGAIYNHVELRAELERLGHRFRTDHSDTEVLIHGYAEWGEDLPRRLNGMFAFCIYDRDRRRLFLARDRFGEKPLYILRKTGLFAFASELNAIVAHRQVTPTLRQASLQKFFAYGFIPAPNAMFEDCEKLPGGAWMTYDLASGSVRTQSYWHFALAPEDAWNTRPEAELAEELRTLIGQAVRRRLIADVPLGIFLSGGVDSTALVAAAAQYRPPSELRTFTLGFSEPSFDESGPARRVAEAIGTLHTEEMLDLDTARGTVMGILERLDEPSGDASILPTALLSRFTARHVKVALSGDGADELFAGYDPFLALTPARLYGAVVPKSVHRLLRAGLTRLPISDRNMSLDFRLRRTLAGLDHGAALWNPAWLAPADTQMLAEIALSPMRPEELYSEALEQWEAGSSLSHVERSLEFYTRFYLQDGILNKTDRASMQASLESRAVFLDNDLVRFCERLPARFKLRGGRRKYLLKKALAGLAPQEALTRPKKGFGAPTTKWLKSLPTDPPLAPVAGLDIEPVARAWADHRRGAADHRLFLWSWLSLQTFGAGRVDLARAPEAPAAAAA